MCAIAGIMGPAQGLESQARAFEMIGSMAHRGPNGVRVRQLPGATLAHARLSVIDLEGGWQPLEAAGSVVIGNGEIYNYLELIEDFGLAGKLATGSDFEPLLHLYAQEGEKAFERLRGMYAFCLIGRDGRTWLVRDPFGIKPLYVSGGRFASEPRAFSHLQLSPQGSEELLSLNYVLKTPSRLVPGAVELEQDKGVLNPLDSTPRASEGAGGAWVLPWGPKTQPRAQPDRSVTEVLTQLDTILEDAVRIHQRSDVPYGLFLSGGVDSTVIATLMARLNQRPVTAYTCGFDAVAAKDERRAAERVARALNLDWRETTFSAEDFWRIAPEVAWFLDDPTADYACLPTFKLAEAAKSTLTVVLSGEGGDELFAGYGRYRRAGRPRWLGGRPAEPQIDARFLKDRGAGALARWRAACADVPGQTALQRAQAADIATWLPNDLLLKLDRCLMAHGLEGRTPFLDKEVAAFAFPLPDHFKVRGRYGKWILRKWLERACTAAEPWARKKGFTVPVASWIAPRSADLGPRVATCQGLAEICDLDAVRAVFQDETQAHNRWPLLFYALWWTMHVGGASKNQAAEAVFGS